MLLCFKKYIKARAYTDMSPGQHVINGSKLCLHRGNKNIAFIDEGDGFVRLKVNNLVGFHGKGTAIA